MDDFKELIAGLTKGNLSETQKKDCKKLETNIISIRATLNGIVDGWFICKNPTKESLILPFKNVDTAMLSSLNALLDIVLSNKEKKQKEIEIEEIITSSIDLILINNLENNPKDTEEKKIMDINVVAKVASDIYEKTKGKGLSKTEAKYHLLKESDNQNSEFFEKAMLIGIIDIVYDSKSSKEAYKETQKRLSNGQ